MAKNMIYDRANRVVVVASAAVTSGQAVHEEGWNGVALTKADIGQSYTLITEGVAEFALAGVTKGAPIYMVTATNTLTLTASTNVLFGKAITASASGTNKFRMAILNVG